MRPLTLKGEQIKAGSMSLLPQTVKLFVVGFPKSNFFFTTLWSNL